MEESKTSPIVKFCPKCATLLKYSYDLKLQMKCYNCTYVEDASEGITVIRSRHDVKTDAMNTDMIKDMTLMNTKRLRCTNASCPTSDPKNWHKYDPVLKMMSFLDKDRKMSLFCPHCNYVYSLTENSS